MKNNLFCAVLGSTGKTEFSINLIDQWLKQNPKGKLLCYDPMHRILREYPPKICFEISHKPDFKWIDLLIEHCQKETSIPKLLVLNSANTMFIKPEQKIIHGLEFSRRPETSLAFKRLLALKRIMNIDIIACFDDPEGIPVCAEFYIDSFFILPILHDFEFCSKSPNFSNFKKCIKLINTYSKLHGKGAVKEWIGFSAVKPDITVSSEINKTKLTKIVKKLKLDKQIELV